MKNIENARMNYSDSVNYLKSVNELPGHNHGRLVELIEFVNSAGDAWVIAEREQDVWTTGYDERGSRNSRRVGKTSVFYASNVVKNVADEGLMGTTRPHEINELGMCTEKSWSCPYAKTLAEAQNRAEAIDMAKRVAFVISFNADMAARRAEMQRNNVDPFAIQTWEWDAERGCEVEMTSTVPEIMSSDKYGGAE